MNPFKRLLFGSGRLPKMVRDQVAGDDVLLLEEGLTGTLTFHNYKAPGKRSKLRKVGVAGAVCVTDRRLLVWGARGKLVDVPRDDERFGAIAVSAEEPDTVLIAWEASLFHDNRSGRVEVRLHPVQAERVVELVRA
ncbi:MAG TPA: hypothetical protein VLL27_12695 [Solirubrobacterales bacterium]|nr:hypothetical protein [Solirubrobacterales bacterium]